MHSRRADHAIRCFLDKGLVEWRQRCSPSAYHGCFINSMTVPISSFHSVCYGHEITQRSTQLLEFLTTFHASKRLHKASSPKINSSHASSNRFFHATITRNSETTDKIRLIKLMGEMGICSRREASRILKSSNDCRYDESKLKNLKEIIFLQGKPVLDGTGVKVPTDERNIHLGSGGDLKKSDDGFLVLDEELQLGPTVPYGERPWNEIRGDTVVLNKPVGYVSGQEEHGHTPAVRLLTRSNLYLEDGDNDTKETLSMGSYLHFSKKTFSRDGDTTSKQSTTTKTSSSESDNVENFRNEATLSGYATAGRLDVDSTGILIFTKSGAVAKRIIAPESKIGKEYDLRVEPASQLSKMEKEMGMTHLPRPKRSLKTLLRGGRRLFDDPKPLKPLLAAEWLEEDYFYYDYVGENISHTGGTLRLVLQEGKKRQIRRMCREILGLHVISLERVGMGPISLGSLPKGKWRPLREEEVRRIFTESSNIVTGMESNLYKSGN